MACRQLSSDSTITDLGENDDEAEKEERRSNSSSSSAFAMVNLTQEEINYQIDQCLKLNAANKINDKNAFQLKMIDFLVYALKKQNSKISNLQMASVCLDVSGKIYGFRVDKVHSDLLKIVGASRGEKRPHENNAENLYNQDANGNMISQPMKKKKRKNHLLSSVEILKGKVETYNPLSMLDNQRDMQASDCLYQARLPKHVNQGIALNLYSDIVLDRLPIDRYNYTSFLIPSIVDYTHDQICPSYADFKFLDWSIEDMPTNVSEPIESDSEYHFNIDAPIVDNDKNEGTMNYRNDQKERFNKTILNCDEDQPELTDFQDVISNNPNPDITYEYSYIHDNHSIHLVRPSHWRVHIKRDITYHEAVRSQRKRRRKKKIKLQFAEDAKKVADSSYFTNDKKMNFSDSGGKIKNKEEDIRDSQNDSFNFSNLGNDIHNNEDFQLNIDEQENQIIDHSFVFSDSELPLQQSCKEAFLGENLVSLPKLTDNIFIPYSPMAKKINMRQLKQSIHHFLHNQETKEFSQLYRELPAKLSKVNAQSLSPGLAFMCILHVSHEKKLTLKVNSDYTDLTIRNCNKV
ncbi:condensin complex subunit 2-like isoform X2 [Phymastichus coffea]|uniref:condensin complex subunit 2-like isoform X2 n=1 Tax=Phymastichus coffea TaxID=108790 RepID=UPI00273AAC39|nr:condensin complex subunit 2-like isoform X2 [Phymastichus coffea]